MIRSTSLFLFLKWLHSLVLRRNWVLTFINSTLLPKLLELSESHPNRYTVLPTSVLWLIMKFMGKLEFFTHFSFGCFQRMYERHPEMIWVTSSNCPSRSSSDFLLLKISIFSQFPSISPPDDQIGSPDDAHDESPHILPLVPIRIEQLVPRPGITTTIFLIL